MKHPEPHIREPEPRLISEQTDAEPVLSPGHDLMPVENREGADTRTGSNAMLSWGARSDVGLVREHNEDSFLVQPPTFAVCDGMGGHAAGEVASSIAVAAIAEKTPDHADDVLLGTAVEEANKAVILSAEEGKGKAGMGSTATCVLVDGTKMSIAHVGDSRVYLLHGGTLVRLTHDHSYVEELVDSGEITADEARVHPSRSVITRALGSDPDMYADHFTLDVSAGDRVILCSDGLSSMVEDSEIEDVAVSAATPQAAADNLVATALTEGGHDNVTVVVVDIVDDGLVEKHRQRRNALATRVLAGTGVVLALLVAFAVGVVRSSWYVGDNDGTVGIYRGVNSTFLGIPLSSLTEDSTVEVKDLPQHVQDSLEVGVSVSSENEARKTIESYRQQIKSDLKSAEEAANKSREGTSVSADNPAVPKGPNATTEKSSSSTDDASDESSEDYEDEATDEAAVEDTGSDYSGYVATDEGYDSSYEGTGE